MKKLLVAVLALTTVSAFAQKSMITFGNFEDDGSSNTFDVSNTVSDDGTNETSTTDVMINYNYAFTSSFMAGITLGNHAEATSANNYTTTGVQLYYNLDGQVNDTCYVALHYRMKNMANDDVTTTTSLEYGHRFAVGSWKGFNLAFSPSVSYAMAKTVKDAAGADDTTENSLSWNWVKFDVLF